MLKRKIEQKLLEWEICELQKSRVCGKQALLFALKSEIKNHEKIFTCEIKCVKIILALAITVGGSLL